MKRKWVAWFGIVMIVVGFVVFLTTAFIGDLNQRPMLSIFTGGAMLVVTGLVVYTTHLDAKFKALKKEIDQHLF